MQASGAHATALVVSPLLDLIRDQEKFLQDKNIATRHITSETTDAEEAGEFSTDCPY